MARNPNWDRWTYASIAKHLVAEIATPLVFDFGGKRTSAWESSDHRAEVTIGGLRTKKVNRSKSRVECDITVIVSSDITANNYTHVDVVGDVANALDQCITVMDYGATGLLEIGTLQVKNTGNDNSVVPDHIKPKRDDDRLHSTVQVTLKGRYSNT